MTKKPLKAGRGSDQFMIRFPPGLRSAIAKRAAKNGRSVNTEIIEAIEQYLSGEDRFSRVETFFEKHRENIEEIAKLRVRLDHLMNWSLATARFIRRLPGAAEAALEDDDEKDPPA
jgi:hypothetical protein